LKNQYDNDLPETRFQEARSILGVDFIEPRDVATSHMMITYTVTEIMALAGSLPPKNVLTWCKNNGYVVLPAPPQALSLLGIKETTITNLFSKTDGYYADQKFARKDKTSFGWLLIKKTPVSGSISKTWNEQNKLLSVFEKVPNIAEMCWFITIYFEVRSIRLFEEIYVRTSSLDSDSRRVDVGYFRSEGFSVNILDIDDRYGCIGLSAARRSNDS